MIKKLYFLQLIYAALASLFNGVSLIKILIGDASLTQTNPIGGLLIMTFVAFSAVIALIGYSKIFSTINLILVMPLAYFGVLSHFKTFVNVGTDELSIALVTAVSINIFGVSVMILGLIATVLKPSIKHK